MKFKSFLTAHKALVKDIVTSTCLVGGTAGIVFGISAGTFKVQYMDLDDAEKRLYASEHNSYLSQNTQSGWNMTPRPDGDTSDHYIDMPERTSDRTPWNKWHKDASDTPFATAKMSMETPEGTEISSDAKQARKEYNSIIIDGAMHTVMDRSFNQSMFEGFADFNSNTKNTNYSVNDVFSYKPSQDNTTDFINTYTAIMKNHKVLGLAGFNHATPLTAMMTHKKLADGYDDPYATCANADDTKIAESTAFILLDANIPDNQNIASVLFRADQPGFLTGLATCSYLIHNLNLYHDHYQDISVACYGGVPIPTVTVYMGGFQRGVELFNYTVIYNCVGLGEESGLGSDLYFGVKHDYKPNAPKCQETFEMLKDHSKYKDDIEEIYNDNGKTPEEKVAAYIEQGLPTKLYDEFSIKMIKLGDLSNHFSGTFSAGDAVGITKQYLNRGAAAIVAVAGPQSLDSAQEIQNQNSKAIVIGVDTAMENSDYQRYHNGFSKNSNHNEKISDGYWDSFEDKQHNHSSESHAIIKFSAIKDLKAVTKKITRLIANGENWDVSDAFGQRPDPNRAVCGVGFQTCANILNGLVSISWDGFVPLMDALEHFSFTTLENGVFSLAGAWDISVTKYISTIGGQSEWEKLPEDYRNSIRDLDKICTYNRYNADGSESSLYQNYSHTMGILGQLMNSFNMKFTNKTSLKPKARTDLSKGFEIIPEGDSEYYTILEWLRYNMYLSC